METKTNLSILSLLAVLFFMSVLSCSSEDIINNEGENKQSEITEILNIGENFGKMHSGGLNFILNELKKNTETITLGNDNVGYILQAANKFIQNKDKNSFWNRNYSISSKLCNQLFFNT